MMKTDSKCRDVLSWYWAVEGKMASELEGEEGSPASSWYSADLLRQHRRAMKFGAFVMGSLHASLLNSRDEL